MKFLSLAAIGLFLLTGAAQAQSPDPSGTYLSESGDTRVRIARCGSAYCGTIVAVQGEAKDVNNPNAGLKGRNLVGVQMISNIQPAGGGFFRTALQLQGRQDLHRQDELRGQGHAALRLRARRPDLPLADLDEGELETSPHLCCQVSPSWPGCPGHPCL
jgi:hypothetical protein